MPLLSRSWRLTRDLTATPVEVEVFLPICWIEGKNGHDLTFFRSLFSPSCASLQDIHPEASCPVLLQVAAVGLLMTISTVCTYSVPRMQDKGSPSRVS